MSNTTIDAQKVRLRGVRLSFPCLFKAESFEGGEAKYSAKFLIHKIKDKDAVKALKAAAEAAIKDKFPKGVKESALRNPGINEANTKEWDGYDDDHVFITATSKRRPAVVDRDLSPLSEADGKPYAGCYVNATVRAYAWEHKTGKGVSFDLMAVQFAKDGDAFGGGAPVNVEEEFEELEDDDDDV